MKDNKKKIMIISIISVLAIITGISYAMFSANIFEIGKTETIIKTESLNLTFTGGNEINCENMIPGDSFTKTFKVENTSKSSVDYNIYMDNVINEFDEDLVYTLSDENGIVIENTVLPKTSPKREYIKTSIKIGAQKTKNYTLKIEYKYRDDKDQSKTQGFIFKTTVGIDTEKINGLHIINNNITIDNLNNESSETRTFKVINDENYTKNFKLELSDLKGDTSNLVYDLKKGDEIIKEQILFQNDSIILEEKIAAKSSIDYEMIITSSSEETSSISFKLDFDTTYEDETLSLNFDENYGYQKSVELSSVIESNTDYTCVDENKNILINLNTLSEGSHTITCSTSGNNGKKTTSSKELNIINKKCIRATTLHTEECLYPESTTSACTKGGYTASNKGTTITYGNLGTKGTIVSGDAFDCDVNGDGKYNSENERFYYVSNYYNPNTEQYETDKVTLMFYNNIIGDVPNNTTKSPIAYNLVDQDVLHGPITAVKNLPTTSQWKNVNLFNTNRKITTTAGINPNNQSVTFDYTGRAARLIHVKEMNSACNITIGSYVMGELENCRFFMENTKYSVDTNRIFGYWTDNTLKDSTTNMAIIHGTDRRVGGTGATNVIRYGVRPAIELYKTDIEI